MAVTLPPTPVALLLREVDRRLNLTERLAACFTDHRQPDLVEHTVPQLVAQRLYGLALGYEDRNDHDQLRADPLLAVLIGKAEPKGTDRRRAQDQGKAGAGKSTLNRLELTPEKADAKARYKKIVYRQQPLDELLTDLFLEAHTEPPARIVLDPDATDDPVHGNTICRWPWRRGRRSSRSFFRYPDVEPLRYRNQQFGTVALVRT